jgi:DnaJ-class molecular chaperone
MPVQRMPPKEPCTMCDGKGKYWANSLLRGGDYLQSCAACEGTGDDHHVPLRLRGAARV